jgi:hypothetical protein
MRHPGLCAHTSAEDESDAGAVWAHLCPPAGHQSDGATVPLAARAAARTHKGYRFGSRATAVFTEVSRRLSPRSKKSIL